MADSRSVMQEFRFLDQRRQTGTLTPAEQARHAELRDLVGFEQPAPARGGFDVTSAAAQLRESLLPAGLRSRPIDVPPPPATTPAPWTPPLSDGPAPAVAEPEPPLASDPYFEPATLGQEVRPQAWNPEAPGYDPDAPYDEAAWIAAGYDPNVTYDWSSLGEAAPAGDVSAEGSVGAEPELEPEPVLELEPVLEPEPVLEAEPDALLDRSEEPTAPAAEAGPLEFGEYDAPGSPVAAVAADAPWFEEAGAAPVAAPPATPAFGEYDAAPSAAPSLAALGEPDFGGPEGEALPGGTPLELGEAPLGWQPEGVLEAGFELASDGSFGEAGGPPPLAPWTEADQAVAAERWESAPALDLSSPFEAAVIRAEPAPAAPPPAGPPAPLDLEQALDPAFEPAALPEPEPDVAPLEDEAPAAPVFESLPAEHEGEPEPVSLGDLDQAIEIDVPPEIAAAYGEPAAGALDFEPAVPLEGQPVQGEPEVEPVAPPRRGSTLVAGIHRVVIHLIDGRVLRGTLSDADLEAPELRLDPGPPGAVEQVQTSDVKAIFFMLASGDPAPVAAGKRVRVTFRDGRQVAGFSPDYREDLGGFFMVPADTRTNTARIWVYQPAVKQVSVS